MELTGQSFLEATRAEVAVEAEGEVEAAAEQVAATKVVAEAGVVRAGEGVFQEWATVFLRVWLTIPRS